MMFNGKSEEENKRAPAQQESTGFERKGQIVPTEREELVAYL